MFIDSFVGIFDPTSTRVPAELLRGLLLVGRPLSVGLFGDESPDLWKDRFGSDPLSLRLSGGAFACRLNRPTVGMLLPEAGVGMLLILPVGMLLLLAVGEGMLEAILLVDLQRLNSGCFSDDEDWSTCKVQKKDTKHI